MQQADIANCRQSALMNLILGCVRQAPTRVRASAIGLYDSDSWPITENTTRLFIGPGFPSGEESRFLRAYLHLSNTRFPAMSVQDSIPCSYSGSIPILTVRDQSLFTSRRLMCTLAPTRARARARSTSRPPKFTRSTQKKAVAPRPRATISFTMSSSMGGFPYSPPSVGVG